MIPERGVEKINNVANIIIIISDRKVEELTSKINARRIMLKQVVTENFGLISHKCMMDYIHIKNRVETIDSHCNKQIKELNRISGKKILIFYSLCRTL